jgi:signal transduction histidine kinase/DNA-binding NarL/FixJ family response regulator
MSLDLFEREQTVLDKATNQLECIKLNPQPCAHGFEVLVKEYGRLLRYIRRITKSSDKAAYESVMAKKFAEAVASSRASFLANMSHEIRTPMNGVIGLADIALHDDTLTEKQKDYLVKIRRSADGLLAIVNDILDLSKIDAGELVFESIPFDLRQVFLECQTLMYGKAEEKGLMLNFYDETALDFKLIGDPTRVRQVLLNFLSNAIKFTLAGSVALRANRSGACEAGSTVRLNFEISDTGIGINPEDISKIFEPFKQADVSTTRTFGGTGLGLTITKIMIEMMGGSVSCDSTAGVGSRFLFSADFEVSSERASQPQDYGDCDTKALHPTFSGKVLLCDDNEINQMVANENLKMIGFDVTTAENGKAALDAVAASDSPFVLIFMDIHMPIMDGIETTKQLIERGVKTPIIAMTASVMKDDKARCLSAGMSDFISKPFKPHKLWQCVLKYLTPEGYGTEQALKSTIDEAAGLSYIGGNKELYNRLLTKYISEQPDLYAKLESEIAQKNYDSARKTAHSMKSVAAMIGAKNLSGLFSLIEIAASADMSDGDGKKMLADCALELSAVINDARRIIL